MSSGASYGGAMSPIDSSRILGSAISRSSVRRKATVSSSGRSRMSSSADASCGMMLVLSEPVSTVGRDGVAEQRVALRLAQEPGRPSSVFSARRGVGEPRLCPARSRRGPGP